MAEAGLAPGGVDGGDDAAVAGELTCSVEAINGSDLALDDDSQDVGDTWERL